MEKKLCSVLETETLIIKELLQCQYEFDKNVMENERIINRIILRLEILLRISVKMNHRYVDGCVPLRFFLTQSIF